MKNHLNIIIALILLLPVALAETNLYNDTILGYSITGGTIEISTSSLDENIEDYQTFNAEGDTQLLTKEAVYEAKKTALLEQADQGWDYILAFFKLIIDFIVLLMYLIEMRLLLYLFVELLPQLFIKIRDALSNWFVTRRVQ